MEFSLLVNSIKETHLGFQQHAAKAVNLSLTLRNWLIGFYIVEFEQKGEDRAKYGEKLLVNLAKNIQIEGLSVTILKLNRQFFLTYPQIKETLPTQLKKMGFDNSFLISQILSDQLQNTYKENITISQALPDQFKLVPVDKLLNRLSFSHFTDLLAIKDSLKRTFYEIETIKGNWNFNLYGKRKNISRIPEDSLLNLKGVDFVATDFNPSQNLM